MSTARATSGVRYSGASNREGVIWLAVGGELRCPSAGPVSRLTRAGARMYLLRRRMIGLLKTPEKGLGRIGASLSGSSKWYAVADGPTEGHPCTNYYPGTKAPHVGRPRRAVLREELSCRGNKRPGAPVVSGAAD